ncbi:hypothetical protein OU994_01300 [Pseudoduganella sp. SL102]|uniref:hypothetical protein n=1 Tax=Pseudoduganella sp. SL102 TaxID=2995154 RepID=UPI00248D180B|nr:hypothetical protein [Pseudoduganella sp. SL102]WBS02972.1 hypothetical protein OU994_01300 [Pseudoduganella sp. SL102]
MSSVLFVTRRCKAACAAAFALACTHGGAYAQAKWTFGGFGTLVGVHSTADQADYTASPISPGQAGYSKEWAFDVDSRLGAQLGVQLDKRWSAVIQVVHEKDVRGSFRPHVEWANVKYQVTPELSVRAGRIALPLFLAADYRKASYALPWVRPPVELYSLMPISSNDGVDATYRWNAWGAKHETQVTLGNADVQITPEIRGKSRDAYAITQNTTIGALTMRATAASTTMNIPGAEEMFDALRSFGPRGVALANRYDIASRKIDIYNAGFSYDPGHWFLMGEIGRVNTRSMLGDQTAGYLSGGYRFGTVAPYATLARVDVNMATQVDGVPTGGLPPAAAGLATLLNTELNARLRSIGVQDTASVGVRWDIAPNYAVKMQLDRVRPRGGSNGTLTNVQPGFRSGHAFGVISAGVDFVF